MTLRIFLIVAVALGGCAGGPSQDLPTCDGSDRRPANPVTADTEPISPSRVAPSSIDGSTSGGCA